MSCLFGNILAQMNRIRPLVHCLTNPVTMQDVEQYVKDAKNILAC